MPINNLENRGTKPFLRWAGSKRKLIPILSEYWSNSFGRYIEPFMGSAALFFHINPNNAIISDSNTDLVDTYNVLRDNTNELYDLVYNYPIDKDFYYDLRSIDRLYLSKLEVAARFIYLNRNCYNGLYRTNKKGEFNVPFTSNKNGALPDYTTFKKCADCLVGVEIVSHDYLKVFDLAKENDFYYIDPPYAAKNSRIFHQYGPDTFGLKDIENLKSGLDLIDSRGAKFVLSYANVPEMKIFVQKWNNKTASIRRNISGFSSHRRMAEELIISNFN